MFDIKDYEAEIFNSYMNTFEEVFFYRKYESEQDFLSAVVYSIQQSTSDFNKAKIPNIKALFRRHAVKKRVRSLKGISWKLDKDILKLSVENEILSRLDPMREFVSTTSDIATARMFAYDYFVKYGKIGLHGVLELEADEYFIVDENTRDMGEGELILINPKVLHVVECCTK